MSHIHAWRSSFDVNRFVVAAVTVAAVLITTGVGAASFRLSFAALKDLAIRARIPADLGWLWPCIVDGTILIATMGAIVMQYRSRPKHERWYFWGVLVVSVVVSIGSNAIHSILPPDQPLGPWLTGFIAGVAPVSLVATTHCLNIMIKVHIALPSTDSSTVSAQSQGHARDVVPTVGDASAVEERVRGEERARWDSWQDTAEAVLATVALKDTISADMVAELLHLTYDKSWTQRQIGKKLELSHHTVGKIQNATAALLRAGEVNIAIAS